ncbi:hypothetical protein NMYAN_20202 [Nitrosomonas nitrosa]|uniref:Uncharacterized protein n=1 Tax=Nitrosomonas nitrosa TaxID=52442 RepID=A0A8H9D8T5_9PROT|nr:hypothetical protein NMYAN_20202 [Nitrosomonas nitrosa]
MLPSKSYLIAFVALFYSLVELAIRRVAMHAAAEREEIQQDHF